MQFTAIAYSPRLVTWFGQDPTTFRSLGIFFAAFTCSLAILAWVDRASSGTVPLISNLVVLALLVVSLLSFSRLVQRLTDLQITDVLCLIGDRGRWVIWRDIHSPWQQMPFRPKGLVSSGACTTGSCDRSWLQALTYAGEPRAIADFDIDSLFDRRSAQVRLLRWRVASATQSS
jgi:hypothetical protein